MPNLFELKRDTINCFQEGAVLARQLGFNAVAETIAEAEKDFQEKELMVVTVGEMKRGKSSMLNALLGEKEHIFPVNASVATNAITIVRYGEEEKVEVVVEERRKGRMVPATKAISRAEISDYVSEQGNPSNFKNVRLLKVEILNPLLKEGVIFVDTPGVGSLNISHAETTYGFLPNADLLLFVSDASSGLTETELNFLKRGYKYCKNVLFPLTKKDANPEYREIMEDNQRKISAALGISMDEVTLIPISNTAKFRYLETKSKVALANSNFPEFERLIWSTIAAKRGEIMFLPFMEQVRQEVFKIDEIIVAQYQLLKSNKEKMPGLIANLEEESEKYKSLGSSNIQWKSELTEFFAKMQNSNTAALSNMKLKVMNHLEDNIINLEAKICEPMHYQQVYNEINSIMSEGLLELKEQMIEETVEEVNRINISLGLNVDSCKQALDNLNFTPKKELDVVFPKRKISDEAIRKGGKISRGIMGGSKVGMVVGGLFGAALAVLAGPAVVAAEIGTTVAGAILATAVESSAVATAAGAFLGGAKGCVDAVTQGRDVDIPVVRKALVNHISASHILLTEIMNDGMITLRGRVISSFETGFAAKKQELKESIEQIKKTMNSTKPNEEKLKELKENVEIIQNYLERLEKLEETVVSMGDVEPECGNENRGDDAPMSATVSEAGKKEMEYSFL